MRVAVLSPPNPALAGAVSVVGDQLTGEPPGRVVRAGRSGDWPPQTLTKRAVWVILDFFVQIP